MKSALTVLISVLLGFTLGVVLARPRPVKAGSEWLYVQKVEEGRTLSNVLAGSQYIGFSCNQDGCYVASH